MFDPPPTATVAHDCRNVLTACRGRIQLLKRQIERGDVDCARLRADLDHVERNLTRLVTLIDAVEAGAPVIVDIQRRPNIDLTDHESPRA